MASRTNVTPLKASTLPPLRTASTSAQGERITGSRNEVWLCPGYDDAGRGVVLYVKPSLPARQIMVEALSAQVGQCMGLPCPDPFVVTVNPKHIGRPRGAKVVAFGSEQIGGRGMAYPILDIDLLLDALRHQKLEDALAAFDEFIANPVRGPRDIFYTPEHGLVVVDHEGAMEAATQPHQAVTNWLAERVLERLPPLQLPVFLKRLRAKVSVLHSSRFGAAPSAVQFEQSGVELYNGLVDFLQQRLSHLDRLLSERVFPGQAYLAPSDRDAPDRAADV
jgi:hypothetical protein